MKSYDELQKSLRFYKTVVVLLVALVLFIGFNNVSTTKQCKKYEDDLSVQQAKNRVLLEEVARVKQDIVMGTCLLVSQL